MRIELAVDKARLTGLRVLVAADWRFALEAGGDLVWLCRSIPWELCVVLDGHDRLVAAVAEGMVPSFVELCASDAERAAKRQAESLDYYASKMAVLDDIESRGTPAPLLSKSRADLAGQLAGGLGRAGTERTRATPYPGGAEAWNATACALCPDWDWVSPSTS